jgi:hypothetical protein
MGGFESAQRLGFVVRNIDTRDSPDEKAATDTSGVER